ncbi:MAG: oxidoreductase, partial [Pseudomonadota bacterium]|nr:oxidoreductase [Pseudomonadota bacterium]
ILRGVTLAGVDSVMAPKARREAAYALLDKHLDRAKLAEITQETDIRNVDQLAADLIDGKVRGRLVFAVS